jgi:hypothetical protein
MKYPIIITRTIVDLVFVQVQIRIIVYAAAIDFSYRFIFLAP